jgi:hypothetical protein
MPWVRFEPTFPASERAKTVHALDRPATVTENFSFSIIKPITFILQQYIFFFRTKRNDTVTSQNPKGVPYYCPPAPCVVSSKVLCNYFIENKLSGWIVCVCQHIIKKTSQKAQDVTNINNHANTLHRFNKEAREEVDAVKIQGRTKPDSCCYSLWNIV